MSTHLILIGQVEAVEVAPRSEALLYMHRSYWTIRYCRAYCCRKTELAQHALFPGKQFAFGRADFRGAGEDPGAIAHAGAGRLRAREVRRRLGRRVVRRAGGVPIVSSSSAGMAKNRAQVLH